MAEARIAMPAAGYEPELGHWVAGLDELRASVFASVDGLSAEALARRAYAGANTIGTLLMHLAEAEHFWMQEVVGGEPLTPAQREALRFEVFGTPQAPQMPARELAYFRQLLDQGRARTRSLLAGLGDRDLEAVRSWQAAGGERREFSLRWILRFLFEHEAHHRGQIALLRCALGL